jgi:type IV pilus assembly protein PilM
MAFHTVWSVDLGRSSLKAVKLRREKNNIEILAIDKIDYPTSTNGVDSAAGARKEVLSVFRSRNDVREPVVVAHPGQGTFSRFIKVPAFEEKKVQDMVQYEASQQIPFPLDEVIWDFHVIDREYLTGEEREVGLFAVRREAIDDFLTDFSEEGLSVEMLSIGYLALLNFIKYDLDPKEPSIVLDIGATHTDLILIDGERFWVRPLPHSGQDITKAIMERFKLKYSEAEKLKTEAVKAPKQAAKIFQAVIQPKLKDLIQEVHRSIGYYRSQNGDVKFSKLYLLGNASRIFGIKRYLEEQLGVMVERMQSIRHLRINRGVNVKLLQSQLPAFGTALGGGLQALGAGACKVDLVPREEKIKKQVERKKKHVFIAAGIFLIAIFVSFFITRGKLEEARETLAQVESLHQTSILKHETEVRKLKGETDVKIDRQREKLLAIGKIRRSALDGLRVIEDVAAQMGSGAVTEVSVVKSDETGAKSAYDAQWFPSLREKLWIPYVNVKLIPHWPEDASEAAPGRQSKTSRWTPVAGKVPAYKVELYAVIQARDTPAESDAFIKERLQRGLRDMLAQTGASEVKDVTVGVGTQGDNVWYVPGQNPPEVLQEGRKFFGAPVTFYMVPEAPAKVEEAGADEADGAAEGDEADGADSEKGASEGKSR